MKKRGNASLIIAHLLLLALISLILLPGMKQVQPPAALLAGLALMELLYLLKLRRLGRTARFPSRIMLIVWSLLIIWELLVTKLNLLHPVLVPAPENVFYVFQSQYQALLGHALSSLELLLISMSLGLLLGWTLGLLSGWYTGLGNVFAPIANVLAPIPPVIFAPYIVAIMPSFRSPSAVVIILGIFFPTCLNMVGRVRALDRQILDSARMLNVGNGAMITKILLPYTLPGVAAGLKVTLTTSFMLLMFAEMMGATQGLGYYIVNYNTYGNYTNVIACIIVIGVIVTLLSRLVTLIQAKVIKWR